MAGEHRKTVLVVEDEWIIADLLARDLRRAGHEVLGPAAEPAAAMRLLEEVTPDMAILDIQIRGGTSFAIADALSARGVPFLFVTAYAEAALPARFAPRPVLEKPFALPALLGALAGLQAAEEQDPRGNGPEKSADGKATC